MLLRQRLLTPQWMAPADAAYLRRVFDGCLLPERAGIEEQALFWETTANLPGDMLVKVDRMSMANSLGRRVCPDTSYYNPSPRSIFSPPRRASIRNRRLP